MVGNGQKKELGEDFFFVGGKLGGKKVGGRKGKSGLVVG
jgi:hypothetical protein